MSKFTPWTPPTFPLAKVSRVRLGNNRGNLAIKAKPAEGMRRDVVIVESIWPNAAFEKGIGINALTGADPTAPVGGQAFHDNASWIRKI